MMNQRTILLDRNTWITILFVVATAFITFSLTKTTVVKEYESKIEDFKLGQAERDSVIDLYHDELLILESERDSLLYNQDMVTLKLDSAITMIKSKTRVKVTDKDVIESLSWIKTTYGLSLD